MEKLHTPYLKPHYRMSKCCEANTATFPACFGEPSFIICTKCNKETDVLLKPVYEEISKGVYRKIIY